MTRSAIIIVLITVLFPAPGVFAQEASETAATEQAQQQAEDAPHARPGAELTIVVTGFENDKGKAMIALSDSHEDYVDRDDPFAAEAPSIEDRRATCSFPSLPPGDYAVKVFHDENDDDELNTGLFGRPTESYGFSNNARRRFGIPDWEKATFTVGTEPLTIEIRVK